MADIGDLNRASWLIIYTQGLWVVDKISDEQYFQVKALLTANNETDLFIGVSVAQQLCRENETFMDAAYKKKKKKKMEGIHSMRPSETLLTKQGKPRKGAWVMDYIVYLKGELVSRTMKLSHYDKGDSLKHADYTIFNPRPWPRKHLALGVTAIENWSELESWTGTYEHGHSRSCIKVKLSDLPVYNREKPLEGHIMIATFRKVNSRTKTHENSSR